MSERVVIIGNGIAGITAARHIRRNSDKRITVISAENKYFFSRTALMYVYMGHMKWEHLEPYERSFWHKNKIELIEAYVKNIHHDQKKVTLSDGKQLTFDHLIIATGSIPRKLGCEGEKLKGVQGLVSKQDLQLLEQNTTGCKNAVIVGGGLIGVELAEMLHSRKIPVTMLIRERSFWRNVLPERNSEFISRHISSHGVKLIPEVEVEKLCGGEKVEEIQIRNGVSLPADFVGMTIGVEPNISFLQTSHIETDRGVLVDPFLRTSAKDVYAIGDCAEFRIPPKGRKSIEAVWYTARMMGETVAQTICGNPFKYNPGNWFNSAKFFEIEYQTYGQVSANPASPEKHINWEDSSGKKAITVAFDESDLGFLGINAFGIRLRHEKIDHWLTAKVTVDYLFKHFQEAHFDPEFSNGYLREMKKKLEQELTLS